MPRAPSDFPLVPTGVQAAMDQDNGSPLYQFVRKYEPNNVELQQQFHTELTHTLHTYVEAAEALARHNMMEKIRDEHATGLDS